MGNLFNELKRRNVFKVGLAYLIVGWLTIQVVSSITPMLELPDMFGKMVLVALLIGFPIALLFAWAFELTPDGIKKSSDVDIDSSVTHKTSQKINFIIIGALVLLVGGMGYERMTMGTSDAGMQGSIATTSDRSIAVLPFVNMSSDPEQEHFSDGLTEEILNSLARTPDLLVTARTTAFSYKDTTKGITEIAKELNVGHVLEGSVRRGGDTVRVTAQLIRASDGNHLWSETFDGEMKDIIAVQEKFAFQIAQALETAMDPEALAAMVSIGTKSVEAYEEYIKGISHLNIFLAEGNVEDLKLSYDAYEHARTIDPTFARAHFQAAVYWADQLDITQIGSSSDSISSENAIKNYNERIEAAIESATNAVDSQLYKAHQARVNMRLSRAVKYFQNYIKERPNDASGATDIANLYIVMSQSGEAQKILRTYEEIAANDFFNFSSYSLNWLFSGSIPDAVRVYNKLHEENPTYAEINYQGQRILLWAGMKEDAKKLVPGLLASDLPETTKAIVNMRDACATNDIERATKAFDSMEKLAPDDVSLIWLGLKLLGRDKEAENKIKSIEAASHPYSLVAFMIYPYFDPTPYPSLMRVFQREGITHRKAIANPIACKVESGK